MRLVVVPHLVRYHPRLLVACGLGALAAAVLPGGLRGIERWLFGWNLCAWCYVLSSWALMLRCSAQRVRELARTEDESAGTVLGAVCLAALASIAAIVAELAQAKGQAHGAQGLHLILAGSTLLSGWLLVATIFTLHYARLYFAGDDAQAPPLRFPDAHLSPDYLDFAYFSFTLAATSQTSDVGLASRPMRRMALVQAVMAFFFNLAVLGVSINLVAGLFG